MDDIFKSIKAYLYDRSTSPLIGAFTVAWSIWNYRIFIAVFSGNEKTTEEIFSQIDKLFASFDFTLSSLSVPINGALYHGLIMPSLITLSYIYIYPLLAKPVYEHSLRKQIELRGIKQKEENNRLLSVEESREIYRRMSDLQVEYSNDVDNYNNQISSLNQTIKELETERASETKQADKLRQTPYDDINDADPEEFDSAIEKNLASIKDGEFQLSNLFTSDQWTSLNATLKQTIGKRFKEKVMRGDFVGVKVARKGAGNQQIYTKGTTDLPPIEEKILTKFAGLKAGYGQTEPDIQQEIGGHIESVRVHLHDMTEKGYISHTGETDDNKKLYELKPKGRKYLVENNLLPRESLIKSPNMR